MDRDSSVAGRTNQLLLTLSPVVRQRLTRSLSPVFLDVKTVLFEPGEVVDAVVFLRNCVVSLVTTLHVGAIVEVATIGNEGIVGVAQVLGGSFAFRAITSVAVWADRIGASTFRSEVERDGHLRAVVSDYVLALFGQIAQAAACNWLHSNEERLSRWLLLSHDRVGTDQFAITHEYLAQMLGSRRATVTLSAGMLQAAGLISYRRGEVTIVDRAGLESAACECYAVIARELTGVVQRARHRSLSPVAPPE